jgi:hypothetical protein
MSMESSPLIVGSASSPLIVGSSSSPLIVRSPSSSATGDEHGSSTTRLADPPLDFFAVCFVRTMGERNLVEKASQSRRENQRSEGKGYCQNGANIYLLLARVFCVLSHGALKTRTYPRNVAVTSRSRHN